MKQEELKQQSISSQCSSPDTMPFSTYAEEFRMIDSQTISLVVPMDEVCRSELEKMRISGSVNTRRLQNDTCSIYPHELADLKAQHVVEDHGTGVWYLTNLDYYDDRIGICFEATDYIL
jgi:hypothetical protein